MAPPFNTNTRGTPTCKCGRARCTILPLHTAKLTNLGGTVREARAILGNVDVAVVNMRDKEMMMTAIAELDQEARKVRAASNASTTHSLDCDFYFLDAEAIRTGSTRALPRMQDVPSAWIAKKRVTFAQVCFGAYNEEYLVISNRWEAPDGPDTSGVQMRALKEYLLSTRRFDGYGVGLFQNAPRRPHCRRASRVQDYVEKHEPLHRMRWLILLDASYISAFGKCMRHGSCLTPSKTGFQMARLRKGTSRSFHTHRQRPIGGVLANNLA